MTTARPRGFLFCALSLAVITAGGVSCGSADSGGDDPSGPCESNLQCPPGQVCDPEARACRGLADDEVVGYFGCTIDGPQEQVGPTDIVARIGGIDVPITTGAACTSDKDMPDLFFEVFVVGAGINTDNARLTVLLDYITPTFGLDPRTDGMVPLMPGAFASSSSSGHIWTYPDSQARVLAWVAGGNLRLLDPPVAGQPLRGWISARLTSPPDSQRLSEPCSTVADCGNDATTRCGGILDDTAAYCYTECDDSPASCEPGGACVAATTSGGTLRHWCVKGCTAQEDCPGGLDCRSDPSGVKGCYR